MAQESSHILSLPFSAILFQPWKLCRCTAVFGCFSARSAGPASARCWCADMAAGDVRQQRLRLGHWGLVPQVSCGSTSARSYRDGYDVSGAQVSSYAMPPQAFRNSYSQAFNSYEETTSNSPAAETLGPNSPGIVRYQYRAQYCGRKLMDEYRGRPDGFSGKLFGVL